MVETLNPFGEMIHFGDKGETFISITDDVILKHVLFTLLRTHRMSHHVPNIIRESFSITIDHWTYEGRDSCD